MGYIYHPFDAYVTKLSLDFDSEIGILLFPSHKLYSHESCLTRRNLHPTRVVPTFAGVAPVSFCAHPSSLPTASLRGKRKSNVL